MNTNLSDKQDTLPNPAHAPSAFGRARRWFNWTTLAFVLVSLVAGLAVGVIIWQGVVDRQTRQRYYEFAALSAPQRLHTLAQLFQQKSPFMTRGYAREAQELFFGLSREEQFTLFTPEMAEEDLTIVIAGLYIALADVDATGATTPLLQQMHDALVRENAAQSAYQLRVELLAWIKARELAAAGQPALALDSYRIASDLNCMNVALWYEIARLRLESGQIPAALQVLEQTLNPTCPADAAVWVTAMPTSAESASLFPVATSQTPISSTLEFNGIPAQFRDAAQIRRAVKTLIYRYPAVARAFMADGDAYGALRRMGLELTLTPTPTPSPTTTPPPTPTMTATPTPDAVVTPTGSATLIPTPTVPVNPTRGPESAGFHLVWPTQFGGITQQFGENPEVYQKFGLPGHEGIDFQAPEGSEIYAAADGVVSEVRLDGNSDTLAKPYGNQVRIQHESGYTSIYAHLSEVRVKQGQAVQAGQVIGLAGNTGNAFGAHLTFVLKFVGATASGVTDYPSDVIDPTPYLLPFGTSSSGEPGGYIFGIHNVSIGDYLAYNKIGGEFLMEEKGKFGWVLFTEVVGRNADRLQPAPEFVDAFREIADKDFNIIVRLNHGYEPGGTLPESQYYDDFALAARRWIELYGESVHIWVIGNEPNNPSQHPGGFDYPIEHITPQRYAECYAKVWTQIHTLPGHENDQVVVAPLDPRNYMLWKLEDRQYISPLDYFTELLAELGKTGVSIDALALHAYTQTAAPELIFSERMFGNGDPSNPLFDHHFDFRVYRDFMGKIPEDLRHVPVYITEASPIYSSEEETSQGWPDANRGWIQNAYREIYDWNKTAGNQQIHALILYRWMGDQWQIMNKYGLYEDFQAAMDYEYVWFDTQE